MDDPAVPATSPGALRLDGLDALFAPRSIALIGASDDETKIGGRPLRYLRELGFPGAIYPVNPHHETVQGLRAYPDLAAIGVPVDLVLIALPAPRVLAALAECPLVQARAVTIFSAGFAETGPEGAALQNEITAFARREGIRVLGPNCLGSMNAVGRAPLTFAAAAGYTGVLEAAAGVALVSQSGAIAVHCAVAGHARGVRFDQWVSTGNECDVELADCLAHAALDDEVLVIAAYLEGCRDGRKLREALQIAKDRGKPVVMLKVGRSEVGARAAASHTASLVGADDVFDALAAEYGVCRVDSIEALLDVVYVLSVGRPGTGDRLGLVTTSGGSGIMMADDATAAGMRLPELSVEVQRRLREVWPPAGVANPIDITAQAMNDPDLLATFLDEVFAAEQFDATVVSLTYMGLMPPWSTIVLDALGKLRATHPEATLVVASLTTRDVRHRLDELSIPVFDDTGDAVWALARAQRLRNGFKIQRAPSPTVAASPALLTGRAPTEPEARAMLREAGVPVLEERLATTPDEAAAAASALGFPVAMKIVSPDIAHKTEVGGVVLDVVDADGAAKAYRHVVDAAKAAVPEARVEGVLVSPMVRDAVETVLGAVVDPVYGATIVFGLGGVLVEVLRDVTHRPAPFGLDVAKEMVAAVAGAAVLAGVRGRPPADVDALCQALSRFSAFVAANEDRIESVDVNPFLVLPEGRGAVAVDALIITREGKV